MGDAAYAAARILVVDDEEHNVKTMARVLRSAGYQHVTTTTDATEFLTLYRQQHPDLILLDLHMPKRDGLEVLEELRGAAGPQTYLPVLVITGDTSAGARRKALLAGAKDFVTKPFEADELLLRIHNLLETRWLHREIVTQNQLLERRVRERTNELEGAYLDTLERLAIAAEFRDDETGRHTERVGETAALLGSALGMDDDELFLIRRAAPLHDVGKIGIPDAILRNPEALTAEEWEIMRKHTTIGARILSGGRSRVVQLAEEIALNHHEHWDGEGYPRGLRGDGIPLVGRLVMVADVFDALTSDRVYRKAWPAEQVLAYIRQYSGKRFDPRIAAVLERNDVRHSLLAIRGREAPLHVRRSSIAGARPVGAKAGARRET
ncbi:MAG TPA: HD domain-containing phosphohydrolase [Gemmatimonadales bacterium]|jgi:putative two-component system response regulator